MDYDDYEDGYFEEFDENITFEEDCDNLESNEDIVNDRANTDTPHDEFKMEEACFLGAMMGFAYEEGLEEKRRREIEKENLELDDILDLEKKDEDH